MIEGSGFEISAPVIAWYAAIVATIMALIRVWDFLKDRVSLKVTFEPNQKIYNDPVFSPDTIYIYIKVVNSGRRPTTVTNVYLTDVKGPKGWLTPDARPPLPCHLTEGKHLFVIAEQKGVDLKNVAHAVAEDALGRKFRCSVAPLYRRIWWRLRPERRQ